MYRVRFNIIKKKITYPFYNIKYVCVMDNYVLAKYLPNLKLLCTATKNKSCEL